MSEFKGTPGPWEIMNGGDIFGPQGGDSGDGVKCDIDDGWQVAEVGIYAAFVDGELVELGDGPREANKKLIAAAPELLEALRLVREDIVVAGGHDSYCAYVLDKQDWRRDDAPQSERPPCNCWQADALRKIDAAIAKALGEDHAD